MRCECGREYEGNFCPYCGKKTSDIRAGSAEKNNLMKGLGLYVDARHQYNSIRFRLMYIGAFITALCGFLSGNIISGIAFLFCGILLFPPLTKKVSDREKIILFVAAMVWFCIGVIFWME